MAEDPANDKLKNLAESLSEELGPEPASVEAGKTSTNVQPNHPGGDIKVQAAAPSPDGTITSVGAGGSVSPSNGERAKSSDGETLSLTDLDKILNDKPPGLPPSSPPTPTDSKVRPPVESMGEVTGAKPEAPPAPPITDSAKPAEFIQNKEDKKTPVPPLHPAKASSAPPNRLVALVKKLVPQVKHGVLTARDNLVSFVKWVRALKTPQKINLVLLILIVGVLIFALLKTLKGEKLLVPSESPFLRSMEQVATRIETLKPDEPMEQFDNPLRNPEYVVLYKKMVVNLKAMSSNRNPMATFEIFIEANTQDTAIELKDRERQFKDVIARVFESIPYDEVVTPEGKNKLKLIIRRDLNQILNKGRVKKVYFKTFFYKP